MKERLSSFSVPKASKYPNKQEHEENAGAADDRKAEQDHQTGRAEHNQCHPEAQQVLPGVKHFASDHGVARVLCSVFVVVARYLALADFRLIIVHFQAAA